MTEHRRSAHRVLIGGYSTSEARAPGGLGLFDTATRRLLARLDLTNPTFGVLDRERRILYSSHSGQDYVSAVAVAADGTQLRLLGRARTGSVNPAHLALSPDKRFLVAASFTSGHVSVIDVRVSGELGELREAMSTAGSPGPLRSQSGSQPHQVVFDRDGEHVFVPDRGRDRVLVYRFDVKNAALALVFEAVARPASGPRHLVFTDATTAWVVNELDNTLAAYRWNPEAETLSPLTVRSTLPDTVFGPSAAGGIATSADRRYLYVSNRGHDSVTTFAVRDAEADWVGCTPVGRTPRFVGTDPETGDLWVAAQGDDRVQRFQIDGAGLPVLAETIAFAAPACVVFA